ncbi:MAG: aldehyde dehydrogenase family protein [Planctomycetaceae bacterium]|nr:aldehyde dehydrogenase family protein [Planctomycetaceae bacterium]MBP62160.1 aldehyde dehydrogenase family protein [Planctomycetaceae bacterium]
MFRDVLQRLGIQEVNSGVYAGNWVKQPSGGEFESFNPATGKPLARVLTASRADYDQAVESCQRGFETWRTLPPPQRGEIIRQLGLAIRQKKKDLGMLVTLEVGKVLSEGEGEVQEMIDICDFATGLSRQLYGRTIASERPLHRMFEQWHPLGPVGVVTAFNFPVAVWAWNAAIAAVCGDSLLWKPSPQAPLTAIATQHIVNQVMADHSMPGIFNLCISHDASVGRWLAQDRRMPLVSATGSCEMGRDVGQKVAARLGRSLLELGGNNGVILAPTANLDLALRAILFAAAGTAGQRCTTLRRLFIHESLADTFIQQLVQAYQSSQVGDPWEDGVLMGPLIHETAVQEMLQALELAREQGGEVLCGGTRLERAGYFVTPTIVRAPGGMPIVQTETFAPILYVMTYQSLDQVIREHNSADQGLSSAIFTNDLLEAERFLSATGSDCGIANVNIGTSGAEIGGAFGGEKETGGGREAGSDAWKAYMRRQTCTVNGGGELPLAQGVEFSLPQI